MKCIYSIVFFFSFAINSIGQSSPPTPVSWSFGLEKGLQEDHYIVTATATIDESWYVYSNKIADGGPIATSLEFDENYRIIGDINEPLTPIITHDDLFDMELIKYKEKAIFTQEVETDGQTNEIKGHVRFMTCNGDRCLPPTNIPFSLSL